jgi:hypothetical protein
MRLHPISVNLKILRGQKSIGHRRLGSKEVALSSLRRWTGQDFGYDARRWGEWLRKNRGAYYRRPGETAPQ